MKTIKQTCVPRDDVIAGGLDDYHFAAQLDRVVSHSAGYEEYTDAGRFFELTHPTSGLKEMVHAVFGHLAGTGGQAFVRAQTSFGGGKSHSLIAIYHLAKGHRPFNISEFVDNIGILPDGPIRVAAVVGDVLDPVNGTVSGDRTVYTLWGEIGSQLGPTAWQAIQESDATRTAPGVQTIRAMLDGAKNVIVVDEIAQHLRVCATSGDPAVRAQASQVAPFLKNLSEEIMARRDTAVVITLATREDAYAGETEEIEAVLAEAMKDVRSVTARKGTDIQPATDNEVAEILKRRLFASVDPAAASQAKAAFKEYYGQLAKSGAISGEAARSITDRIETTYPFHPALVDVLDKRIGTIPNFQRTRGALRLLSRVIAHYWNDAPDVPVILNAADIPLGNEYVVRELTVRIDRNEYQQVVHSDIAGPAAHAAQVDESQYQGRPIAQRAATTVFVHSIEQSVTAGATMGDVAVGTLVPGDDAGLVDDSLNRLHDHAWHLTWDNVRWRFQPEPNANRIIADEADRILNSNVATAREAILKRMLRPTATIATNVYPDELNAVPDESKLHLAAPHHNTISRTSQDADSAPALLREARSQHLSQPRTHRNGIAYLIADSHYVESMDDAIRRMIAAHTIVDDETRMRTYSEQVRSKIRNIAYESQLQAHIAVGRCYRHLYYPASNASNGDLTHTELSANVQGAIGDNIPRSGALAAGKAWTDEVWNTLVKLEKVRQSDNPLAPEWIKKKTWPKGADRVRTSDILDAFWRDHSAPLLTDTQPIVRGVQTGVIDGDWVVQDMRNATDSRGKVWSNRDGNAIRPIDIHADVWLVDYQTAVNDGLLASPLTVSDIVAIVARTGAIDAPTLRTEIETLKHGHEPTKKEVREMLAGAVQQKRISVTKNDAIVTAGDLSGDKVGFDDLIVGPYTEAQDDSYDPRIPKQKRFEGNSATQAEAMRSWAAELIANGHTAGIVQIGVTVESTPSSGAAAETLIAMLGSTPKLNAVVTIDLMYEIPDVVGSITVNFPDADKSTAQQKLAPLLKALSQRSATPTGTSVATFILDTPHTPDAPAINDLLNAVTTFYPGVVLLTGRVA